MERWVGRVALITGASSGIGAELCARLVKDGMKVVGCGRNVDKIQVLLHMFVYGNQGNRLIYVQVMKETNKTRKDEK